MNLIPNDEKNPLDNYQQRKNLIKLIEEQLESLNLNLQSAPKENESDLKELILALEKSKTLLENMVMNEVPLLQQMIQPITDYLNNFGLYQQNEPIKLQGVTSTAITIEDETPRFYS